MSEYTIEIISLCNIILFACVLVMAYMAWTARRARDQRSDWWQKAEQDLKDSNAEKDKLQARVEELTEELAEARKVLDGKDEEFVLIRRPRLIECECKCEASMLGRRFEVFRFTVEDINPPGDDAERLTKILRSSKILIKGVKE